MNIGQILRLATEDVAILNKQYIWIKYNVNIVFFVGGGDWLFCKNVGMKHCWSNIM